MLIPASAVLDEVSGFFFNRSVLGRNHLAVDVKRNDERLVAVVSNRKPAPRIPLCKLTARS